MRAAFADEGRREPMLATLDDALEYILLPGTYAEQVAMLSEPNTGWHIATVAEAMYARMYACTAMAMHPENLKVQLAHDALWEPSLNTLSGVAYFRGQITIVPDCYLLREPKIALKSIGAVRLSPEEYEALCNQGTTFSIESLKEPTYQDPLHNPVWLATAGDDRALLDAYFDSVERHQIVRSAYRPDLRKQLMPVVLRDSGHIEMQMPTLRAVVLGPGNSPLCLGARLDMPDAVVMGAHYGRMEERIREPWFVFNGTIDYHLPRKQPDFPQYLLV